MSSTSNLSPITLSDKDKLKGYKNYASWKILMEAHGTPKGLHKYWRNKIAVPGECVEDSNDDAEGEEDDDGNRSEEDGEEEEYDDEGVGEMGDSYISQASVDENGNSILSGSAVDDEEEDDALTSSMLEADDDVADDLTPGLEKPEDEDEKSQVLPSYNDERDPNGDRVEDEDAEIITGMKGIALERGDSQPEEVY